MIAPQLTGARLLIVDDNHANALLLKRMLAAGGYTNLIVITDSREAVAVCAQQKPDLLLLDLYMSPPDGFEVLQALRDRGIDLPVLVLTADVSREVKLRALAGGARDFLTKPLERVEVLLRVKNLLEVYLLQKELAGRNEQLESTLLERNAELEAARAELLARLAMASEYRDDDTGHHTQRVGRLAGQLGRTLGLPAEMAVRLEQAAPLHDLGKLGVPDAILLKPGPLTPPERDIMKTHAKMGAQMLSGSRFAVLQMAEEIALTHHEWWDGNGYPSGLSGEAIPLWGRIVAVADSYDALTHARPYKLAWTPAEALAEIQRRSGTQFDPMVVGALLAVLGVREQCQADGGNCQLRGAD